jgi:predicted DNA-binding protein
MNTVQLGIRISSSLNQRLTAFMAQTGMSKTEVVTNALASYMGCTDEISITDRMASIEAKMALLEALVKQTN